MKGLNAIEALATRHLVTLTATMLVLVVVFFIFLLSRDIVDLEDLSSIVDIALKSVAGIVGSLWALNRYFTNRVDAHQVRIDADVSAVPAGRFPGIQDSGLLIARLDVVNTGKILLEELGQRLILFEVYPTREGLGERILLRWPDQGLHPVGPIEPGSWSAVNFAHPISSSTAAVRIYTEIHVEGKPAWSWHKTFPVQSQV